jgi:two-component system chemotaxis response regulator CheB
VDRLVTTALAHFDAACLVGVLMTGMGSDGAASMTRLREAGGRTIAEAEETAVVWGMPGELVRAGGADVVVPVDGIARQLMDWAA